MHRKSNVLTASAFASLLWLLTATHTTADEPRVQIQANHWTKVDLDAVFRQTFPGSQCAPRDGFSDSVYRSDAGTILIRTCAEYAGEAKRNSGFYTNTTLEWNPRSNQLRRLSFTNWHGGSSGSETKAYTLPAFDEQITPTPRHTYDGICYVTGEKSMYQMLGANRRMSGKIDRNGDDAVRKRARSLFDADNRATWKLNLETGDWKRIDDNITRLFNVSPYEQHLQYWPQEEQILFFDSSGRKYALFDLEKQRWREVKLEQPSPMSLYHARSTWDSRRGLWVFRKGHEVCTFDPNSREFRKLPDPYDLPSMQKKHATLAPWPYDRHDKGFEKWKGICYISKHDVYLVTSPSAADTRAFFPESGEWQTVDGGGAKLFNGYCQYDEQSDQVLMTYNLWAFRFRYEPDTSNK